LGTTFIIVDQEAPGFSAFEFMRKARQSKPNFPILLLKSSPLNNEQPPASLKIEMESRDNFSQLYEDLTQSQGSKVLDILNKLLKRPSKTLH
jgi:CheY-like chemotaxis protein